MSELAREAASELTCGFEFSLAPIGRARFPLETLQYHVSKAQTATF